MTANAESAVDAYPGVMRYNKFGIPVGTDWDSDTEEEKQKCRKEWAREAKNGRARDRRSKLPAWLWRFLLAACGRQAADNKGWLCLSLEGAVMFKEDFKHEVLLDPHDDDLQMMTVPAGWKFSCGVARDNKRLMLSSLGMTLFIEMELVKKLTNILDLTREREAKYGRITSKDYWNRELMPIVK